ncbi:hypothetical protein C8F01DRAFT_968518, partial [Mycena amicta]
VSDRFTLNKKQRLAFLLKINADIHRWSSEAFTAIEPFRLILGGPGGAGKSHVNDAIRAFYQIVQKLSELLFTAPTGVAANNAGDGAQTTHQALSLRTKRESLSKTSSAAYKALAERLAPVRTLFIDEIYFLGCDDFERISENIKL